MMFMDPSKYQQQAATASSQFYHEDTQPGIGGFAPQFNQYEVDSVDVPRHICPVCNKTFRASSLLDIHMRVHVGAKPFVCPVCNHRATQKGNLKLHMKKHHGQDLPSHIDLVPDSGIWGSFPQAEGSEEHDLGFQLNNRKKTALAHSSLLNEEVVELIKKCQNNIGQSTMGRITESLKDFLDIAQERLEQEGGSSKFELQKEEMAHENINSNNNGLKLVSRASRQTPPPLTPISAENNPWPLVHPDFQQRANVSIPQKQYCYCKICGWKTTSSGYLNVHMRKHKAESHVCTICGRAFKETWYLKNHMRSHVNDVVYDSDQAIADRKLFRRNSYADSFRDAKEEVMHEKSAENATCSMCSRCGLIFQKSFLPEHFEFCGNPRLLLEDCKVCDAEDNKNVFMECLDLVTEPAHGKIKQKNLKNFSMVIGNFLVYLSNKNESNAATTIVSDDPLYSLKKEIENSISQNGIEATKRSFQELIQNPDFKILLSPEHLEKIAGLFDNKEAHLKNNNLHLNSGTLLKDKVNHFSESKPYKNSAMQSLADIGKSLAAHKSHVEDCETAVNNVVGDQRFQGYQCDYCPKWFKYKSVLGIHMRSHTGERPYKCPYCGYAGTQHNCLKLHVQRHHPEVTLAQNDDVFNKGKDFDLEQEHMLMSQATKYSPARCPICDRVSPSPGYLKIHMRSHKKSLDHVCHICGRGFKEYWYLSTHLRTHDNELNMPSVATEEPRSPEMVTDSRSSSDMQSTGTRGTLRNTLLTKQQSVPLAKRETDHMGHSYLSGTSSWSPLNLHENFSGSSQFKPAKPLKLDPARPHVSKRKAFQPSRHRAEPYTPQESVRSRKSKPRKLSQGSYLAPVYLTLASTSPECDMKDEVFKNSESIAKGQRTESDQPLDLSVPPSTEPVPDACWKVTNSDNDEPLNLAIK